MMPKRIQIPDNWYCYPNDPNCFVTYYGDIFVGTPYQDFNFLDRIFIIQNDKLKELTELKPEDKTIEKYRTLGHELTDTDIIQDVFKYNILKSFKTNPIYTGGTTSKRMFIFGAAASAYCVFGDNNKFKESKLKPPTGFEIFDEKYEDFCKKYPAVIQTIPYFESKGRDIESCMEAEWTESIEKNNQILTSRHINVQYYLFELMRAISNEVATQFYRNNLYSLFFNKLQKYFSGKEDERLSIVSFNYDTILEQFYQNQFNIRLNSIHDYIEGKKNKVVIFKPHGSCNWGWKFREDRINGISQDKIASFLFEKNILPFQVYFKLIGDITEVVDVHSWGEESRLNPNYLGRMTINKDLIELIPENAKSVYFPSLLLPYRDKDDFVMPQRHFHAMEEAIRNTKELYLIGWKGNEDLFNRCVLRNARQLVKIVIVNPEPEPVKSNLAKHLDLTKYQIVEIKDFESFILNYLDIEISLWTKD